MKYLIVIINSLLIGFAFTSFVVLALAYNKNERLQKVGKAFLKTAIRIIRWVGIAAIVIWMLGTFWEIFTGGISAKATNQSKWIFWLLLLGPLITQLLWIDKIKSSFIGIVFVVSGLLWTSGVFLEDIILVQTSFHRDYGSSLGNLLGILLEYVMRISAFIALVWLVQSINARRKLKKKNNFKLNK